ncbi:MAG: ABC transporter permease, partial [Rhodospirillales bacterium]|nr:ABC transporter permease [Rhodospirillales bacterium]
MTDAATTGRALPADGPLTTADGRPLKSALARAERMRRVKALLLVLPLLLFIGITFLFPIALMLFRSVDNPIVADNMPRTIAALETWDDRGEPPDEAVFAALAADLAEARRNRTIGRLATRLNYETGGLRSTVT